MKLVLALLVLVGLALGIWVGVRTPPSASTKVETWLALVFAALLALSLWVWFRARPGSGDAMMMPLAAWAMASLLVAIVPQLVWPANERLHLASTAVNVLTTGAVLVVQIRRLRHFRASARRT